MPLPIRTPEATPPLARPSDLLFDNGLGGFSADGREYVIYLEPGQWTPAPWINVIANPDFGFTVSETGGGLYLVWQQQRKPAHALVERSGHRSAGRGDLSCAMRKRREVWSPTPLPCRAPAPYLIRHGAGYSIFEHNSHGLRPAVAALCRRRMRRSRWCSCAWKTRGRSRGASPRRSTPNGCWVSTRDTAQQYVVSEYRRRASSAAGAQSLQRRIWRARRLCRCQQAAARPDGGSHRVPGAHGKPQPARRARSDWAGERRRAGPRSVRRAATSHRSAAGRSRKKSSSWWARARIEKRPCDWSSNIKMRQQVEAAWKQVNDVLGRAAGDGPGANA